MATIRFAGPGVDRMVRTDATAAGPRTLLALARTHGIPILFNCEAGDCGACVVRVETVAAGSGPAVPLTDKERFLLEAMSLSAAPPIAAAGQNGSAPAVRLACQYQPADEAIVVRFQTDLGSR